MRKTWKWKINNGANVINQFGGLLLRQIGPMDFDSHYEANQIAIAQGDACTVPYRQCADGSFVFKRKRDRDHAVETLRLKGFRL